MSPLPLTDLESSLPFRKGERNMLPLLDVPGKVKSVLAALDAGVTIPPHPMPCEGSLLLISGAIEFLIGETWHTVKPGQFLRIPSGTMHSVRALESSRFLVVQSLGGVLNEAH